MAITEVIIEYRRFLKRQNCSSNTLRNYMNTLKHFIVWLPVTVEAVTHKDILSYMDHLYEKRLKPKTINSHLDSIRGFYNYLIYEERMRMDHPVKPGYAARVPEPLPKYLKDEEVNRFSAVIENLRDQAMFMIMLRCGLRVEEVANLTVRAIDLPRSQLMVLNGKGSKDRVVYISHDAAKALSAYLKTRASSRVRKLFLVEKGSFKGRPISVRGIQKRMEYYAKKAGIKASCHQLRHTMATQLLNADADLVTIQDLLGHTRIRTTQRYCRVSNLKVQRDYHKAMAVVMER
jgi:site-specific recombinase XerD